MQPPERGVWTVATVRGITLAVHRQWLLVLAAVAALVAEPLLTAVRPDWTIETRWLVGVAVVLLAEATVLLHELGHAWVARARTGSSARITLYGLGACAELADESRAPADRFYVALAGPAVNAALAFVGWLLVALTPGDLAQVSLVAWLVALSNVGVGVLNLVPVGPSDGHQVRVAMQTGWRPSLRPVRQPALESMLVVSQLDVDGAHQPEHQ